MVISVFYILIFRLTVKRKIVFNYFLFVILILFFKEGQTMKKYIFITVIVILVCILLIFSANADRENQNSKKTTENILFGRYEQDGNAENGPEPIEWIVIKEDSEKILVLSKSIIDLKPYDEKLFLSFGGNSNRADKSDNTENSITWEGSTIQHWLNSDFFATAFLDGEEKDRIIHENSEDRIFLLSEEEVEKMPLKAKACDMTEYCKGQIFDSSGWMLKNLNYSAGQTYVNVVDKNGDISHHAAAVQERNGVRPAMWIRK